MKEILQYLVKGEDLPSNLAKQAFEAILSGNATDIAIGAFLGMLAQKGESVNEILAGMEVLNSKANKLKPPKNAMDIVGTGGDCLGTLNISTTAAFITAAAGIPVAKHGSNAVSSKTGASDVLTALGVKIEAPYHIMQRALDETNITFMFAPLYHGAVANVKTARRDLGIRTIFNFLGPICNPADVKRTLLGISKRDLLEPFAEVLIKREFESFMIVNGDNNMDEISLSCPTFVMYYDGKNLHKMHLTPENFGFEIYDGDDIKGGDPAYNAKMLREILEGKQGNASNLILINSAAALMVGGAVDSLKDGVALSQDVIKSGKAIAKLEEFIKISNQ